MTELNVKAPVPAHVPLERVVDFNAMHPLIGDELYHDAYMRMSAPEVPDIFWSPYNGGHWVLRRNDLLNEVFQNSDAFISTNGATVPRRAASAPRFVPIESDPPQTAAYRDLFSSAFTVKALAAREAGVRALAIQLIEGFRANGHCEFVSEFAQHLPMRVFLEMVDLPDSDRMPLIRIVDASLSESGESKEEAFAKLVGYVAQKVTERSAKPGEDLISKIATAQIAGRPITTPEAISVSSLLLIGGLDTVASMMGHIMHFLAAHPDHRRQLQEDPALIKPAVEEFLRRFALANPARSVRQDIEFHGVFMKAEDMVLMATPFGAVDPDKYPDALRVDFKRTSTTKSTFGAGAHVCPGSMLARLELKVLLEEWLPRIPEFEVNPADKPRVRTGINGSFEYLPLVWSQKTELMRAD